MRVLEGWCFFCGVLGNRGWDSTVGSSFWSPCSTTMQAVTPDVRQMSWNLDTMDAATSSFGAMISASIVDCLIGFPFIMRVSLCDQCDRVIRVVHSRSRRAIAILMRCSALFDRHDALRMSSSVRPMACSDFGMSMAL